MKNLLAKFLQHNSEMLARSADHNTAPHYQGPVWLRAMVRGQSRAEAGWIGGNPCLPDPFHWPERDGQAYQFLCQIDCAALPRTAWGGLGPRTGWLTFFASTSGRVDATVIYSNALGPEQCCAGSWRKALSSRHAMDDRYDRHLGPPVRWPLEFVVPAEGESGVPDRLRQRPTASMPFRLTGPEHRPFDWVTLDLLVSEALGQARKLADDYAFSERQHAAALAPPPEGLVQAVQDYAHAAEQLRETLAASADSEPFSPEGWLARLDLICRSGLAEDEIALQRGASFLDILQKARIEAANNIGILRNALGPSPLFAADTAQGRAHAELVRLAEGFERDIVQDASLPPPSTRPHSPDYAAWQQYRTDHPRDWAAYAARLRNIRGLFRAFRERNREVIAQLNANSGLGPVPPPSSWEEALQQAGDIRRATQQWTDRLHQDQPETRERMHAARDKSTQAGTLAAHLLQAARSVGERGLQAAFVPEEWATLYRLLDEATASGLLNTYWAANYVVLRAEIAKRLRAEGGTSLPAASLAWLEDDWQFDAEQATLQLGGLPRGWCSTFIHDKPKSIMLLQIPTNHLTQFAWGDVSDLVISITQRNLARCKFEIVSVDVSN